MHRFQAPPSFKVYSASGSVTRRTPSLASCCARWSTDSWSAAPDDTRSRRVSAARRTRRMYCSGRALGSEVRDAGFVSHLGEAPAPAVRNGDRSALRVLPAVTPPGHIFGTGANDREHGVQCRRATPGHGFRPGSAHLLHLPLYGAAARGRRPDRVAPGTDRSLAPVHQLSELVWRGAVGLVTIGV